MRFMILVKATLDSEAGVMPSTEQFAEMGRFNEEMVKAGIVLAAEGLHPSSKGVRVRFSGTERTVPEGPRKVAMVKAGIVLAAEGLHPSSKGVRVRFSGTERTVTEGPRKVAGVMHKDEKRYAATGGWGYEGFAGGDKAQRVVGKQAESACFSCHAPEKDRDYQQAARLIGGCLRRRPGRPAAGTPRGA